MLSINTENIIPLQLQFNHQGKTICRIQNGRVLKSEGDKEVDVTDTCHGVNVDR
jgi:hypothetical protein